jgi:hypothetical protein
MGLFKSTKGFLYMEGRDSNLGLKNASAYNDISSLNIATVQ